MSVPEKGVKTLQALWERRSGEPRKMVSRDKRPKRRPVAYVSANGPTSDESAAIGTATSGGGGAGGS